MQNSDAVSRLLITFVEPILQPACNFGHTLHDWDDLFQNFSVVALRCGD